MNKRNWYKPEFILIVIVLFFTSCINDSSRKPNTPEDYAIVPVPTSLVANNGRFMVSKETRIELPEASGFDEKHVGTLRSALGDKVDQELQVVRT